MATQSTVKPGDVTQRVGVEVIRARGVDVEKLIQMLVANAAAEFASTYYYYTILRMNLAGYEDVFMNWADIFLIVFQNFMTRLDVPQPSCPIHPR
jgi:hypothetical protein